MQELVNLDGKNYEALRPIPLSAFDHGLLYGDGVFEGIRFSKNGILLFSEHVDRLFSSAKAIGIKIPKSKPVVKNLVAAAIASSDLPQGYVRLVVTRGVGDLGVDPFRCTSPQIIGLVSEISIYPKRLYESGLNLHVCATRKPDSNMLPGHAKTCNYLNNVLAAREYHEAGCQEGLMLTRQGFVSEATLDNVFGVRGHVLFTPSLSTNCLPGITRAKVMEIAGQIGLRVEEGFYPVENFLSADEVFLTGTGAGIIGVCRIDGNRVGSGKPGPQTKAIRKRYEENMPAWSTPIPRA